jgi:hypothetical protein
MGAFASWLAYGRNGKEAAASSHLIDLVLLLMICIRVHISEELSTCLGLPVHDIVIV